MGKMTNQATASVSSDRTLQLLMRQIRFEGKGINSYELVDPDGEDLPAFSAGSHIDVHLKGGVVRQYSLCNSPAEHKRYVIAVLRDESGRGGSKAVHEHLHVQDTVRISRPRNNFKLVGDAQKIILLAGGIGVTPLKAMAHELDAAHVDYELHYCAKDARSAAFAGELDSHGSHGSHGSPDTLDASGISGRVHLHFDGGNPADGLDIVRLLGDPAPGTHVYYCGPAGFMKACAAAASHWPAGTVHFEHFKVPDPVRKPVDDQATQANGAPGPQPGARAGSVAGEPANAPADSAPDSFEVRIASTGLSLRVAPGQSIVDALEEGGVSVETSCRAGLCGTCKVRYLEGEVVHHDCVLDDDEKREYLTACVSRAAGKLLVLDL
jgi:vanillate O-demethylase ferredoxin subunit